SSGSPRRWRRIWTACCPTTCASRWSATRRPRSIWDASPAIRASSCWARSTTSRRCMPPAGSSSPPPGTRPACPTRCTRRRRSGCRWSPPTGWRGNSAGSPAATSCAARPTMRKRSPRRSRSCTWTRVCGPRCGRTAPNGSPRRTAARPTSRRSRVCSAEHRATRSGAHASAACSGAQGRSTPAAPGVVGALQPDFVLGLGSYLPESTYFGEVAREARRVGARMVFWATEEPYEQDASYRIERDFDAIFSCDRWGVNFHRHKHAYHLPLAGCGVRHVRPYDEAAERPIDVMFCGVAFSSRKELIEELRPSLAGLNISFIGPGWGQFGFGFSDRRIEKDQLIDLYGQSKIVLNLGRSLHFENQRYMIVPSSPGPRTYEAALAGALQLFHEDTYEIRRYFTADEMPTFSNKREF